MHKLGSGLELWGVSLTFYLAVFSQESDYPMHFFIIWQSLTINHSHEPWLLLELIINFAKFYSTLVGVNQVTHCITNVYLTTGFPHLMNEKYRTIKT